MKSIMQEKDGTCFLCKLLEEDDSIKPTEEHHVFGGRNGNRDLSERYGLKVYLCKFHHTVGPEAVHGAQRNDLNVEILHKLGQQHFKFKYPNEDFVKIFGKNYL